VPSADAGALAGQDFQVEIHETPESPRVLVIDLKIVYAKIAFFVFFGIAHNFLI